MTASADAGGRPSPSGREAFPRHVSLRAGTILLALLALLDATIARAAPPWSFELHDADARPLAGVRVEVEGTAHTTITDVDGRAQLPTPPGPTATLIIEGNAHHRISIEGPPWPVVVRAPFTSSELQPPVEPATVLPIPHKTTILAPRPPPPTASTTRLEARDLRAIPFRSADDALRLVPGLALSQHGAEGKAPQIFLRGIDAMHGADFAVALEGIPLNESSHVHAHGMLDLTLVIPETIASFEVVKGPFALDQRPFAVAGSGAIRLGIPASERGLRIGYGAGTTNRHRAVLTFSPEDGDGRDFLAIEALHDDGFGARRAVERAGISAQLSVFDSATEGNLRLLIATNLAAYQLPGLLRADDVRAGRIGRLGAHDERMSGTSGRALAALIHTFSGNNLTLQSTLWSSYRHQTLRENFTGNLLDPLDGDARRQRQRTRQLGVASVLDTRIVPTLRLEVGLGALADLMQQDQHPLDLQLEPGVAERRLDAAQSQFDARIGLHWQPLPTWRIAAGLRFDMAQVHARDLTLAGPTISDLEAVVSPRIHTVWRPDAHLQFFAAYGRGQRPPEARAFAGYQPEQTGLDGEIDLYRGGAPRFTTSDALELGIRWEPVPNVSLALASFGTWIARESVFDHVSGLNLEMNATRRLGLELALAFHPFEWLALHADATVVDARFVRSGAEVPMAPPLVAGLRGVLSHPSGFSAGLRVQTIGPRPLPFGARGSTQWFVDATLGWRWKRLSIELAIENMFDLDVRQAEYHFASAWPSSGTRSTLPAIHVAPGAPLNARLGLSLTF
jgi:iron complex outermembrane receptor protein